MNVAIIGAGPAGLLLAHYLSRRSNYLVNIYEGRSKTNLTANGSRSFPISLQARGRKAIRVIPGLEEAIAKSSTFCQGTIVHRQNGKSKNIKRKNSILTIDRNRLVNIMLRRLSDQANVQVHFDRACTKIDSTTKTITLQANSLDSFSVNYDLLIGADGANSPVREHLQQLGKITSDCTYVSDVYKSLYLERLNPDLDSELAADRIHSSSIGNNIRIILVPQPENKLNGVIIFQTDHNPFAELTSHTEVLNFFAQNFPAFAPLMSEAEAKALLTRPIAKVLTVRCDRFDDGDSILFVGDAAHAVSPSIGQGCNSALEDIFVLGQLVEQHQDDWSKIVPSFSQQRVPDAHALRELSDYSFPRTKLLVVEFFLRLTLRRFWHKLFPSLIHPFLFDLVLDSDMPYSQILDNYQGWINKVKFSRAAQ